MNKSYFQQQLLSVKIMGVLNLTPDSFSDGGLHDSLDKALSAAEKMIAAGVYVIDIGGESTRPGAAAVPPDEELRRTIPVINALRLQFPDLLISIDTYKSQVARQALNAGANWINDISGGTFSEDMFHIAANAGATIIISHIKGMPRDMQKNPHYDDVVAEICGWLAARAQIAQNAGVPAEKIIIDPGIGFGKRFEDNITILHNLHAFKQFGFRLLVGASRKKFIGHYTGEDDASLRDPGSFVAAVWAAANGADFLRVHDVAGTVQALKMAAALLDEKSKGDS